MQIGSSQPDPEITRMKTDNQIQWAVAKKVMQADKQQSEAALELVKSAAQITQQLDQQRIDVKL